MKVWIVAYFERNINNCKKDLVVSVCETAENAIKQYNAIPDHALHKFNIFETETK